MPSVQFAAITILLKFNGGKSSPMPNRTIIKAGDRFNSWTVIEEVDPFIYEYSHARGVTIRRFLCRCACGATKPVTLNNLRASPNCLGCGLRKRSLQRLRV
jgi:hypothetical protein